MDTAIVWFRRDLRLADNPALRDALQRRLGIIPVYIHAPEEAAPWDDGGASRWWLYHSLTLLAESLRSRGSRLLIWEGPSLKALQALIAATGASHVFWNRRYEPALRTRDARIEKELNRAGVQCITCNAGLLFEPWTLSTGKGDPYRVFTPFWRACLRRGIDAAPLPAPSRLSAVDARLTSRSIESLGLRPAIPWDRGLTEQWEPGEAGARRRLKRFMARGLAGYPDSRDAPGREGTSRLSPHLHFGEISPRQIVAALHRATHEPAGRGTMAGAEAFLRELGWREFAYHVLHHFPHTAEGPLDPRFAGFPWRRNPKRLLRAWQHGRTGFPIVDAGMRELWHTGWMHNRVRMIAASFLTKHCRIDWEAGARWFWDTLVDADLANNTLGWQWVAGCGADAAPYFRIFNPVRQSRRFDPDGVYVRRWLPEIAALPDRWLHEPWRTPPQVQSRCGVRIGRDYPGPILDLAEARAEALKAFRRSVRRAA